MQTMRELETLLDTALTGSFVHQPVTPIPEWLTKYTDEIVRFVPASKHLVAAAITNETGAYVFAGHKAQDVWTFTFLTTCTHETPWTSWGTQVDYRW